MSPENTGYVNSWVTLLMPLYWSVWLGDLKNKDEGDPSPTLREYTTWRINTTPWINALIKLLSHSGKEVTSSH